MHLQLDSVIDMEIFEKLRQREPLIHCITSPIAINDCANAILAIGARPICAEHPEEVEEITGISAALGVSLANITDARARSIVLAGKMAMRVGILSVIDLVGIACSSFRLRLAHEYLSVCKPAIIKGNASEIRKLAEEDVDRSAGIDVSKDDVVDRSRPENMRKMADILRELAKKYHAVVVATGAVDLVSDGNRTLTIENGVPELSRITGTGCILNSLMATCLSVADPLHAATFATVLLGVAGEMADASKGFGTYHVQLMDALSKMGTETIRNRAKISILEER